MFRRRLFSRHTTLCSLFSNTTIYRYQTTDANSTSAADKPPASDELKQPETPTTSADQSTTDQTTSSTENETSASTTDSQTVLDQTGDALIVDPNKYVFPRSIVDDYAENSLKRDGRFGQNKPVLWSPDHCSYPIVVPKGQRPQVYDHMDDVPQDVTPAYEYSVMQQREYFENLRKKADFYARARRWTLWAMVGGVFACGVIAAKLFLSQPSEVTELRLRLLQGTYGKVLEVGAGHGLNVGNYPYAAEDITFADSSDTFLTGLRARLPKTVYPTYTLVNARTEKLDMFPDASFDCVVDMFGLCSCRDQVMALRELQRVCKPTGTIFLLEHGKSNNTFVDWILQRWNRRDLATTMSTLMPSIARVREENKKKLESERIEPIGGDDDPHSLKCKPFLDVEAYLEESRVQIREQERHHLGTTYYIVAHPEQLDEKTLDEPSKKTYIIGSREEIDPRKSRK